MRVLYCCCWLSAVGLLSLGCSVQEKPKSGAREGTKTSNAGRKEKPNTESPNNDDRSNTKRVVKLQGSRLLHTIKAQLATVALSPDSTRIAGATAGNKIILWSVEKGQLLHTLRGHTGKVNGLDFSPDSKHLVSASDDKTIKVWEVESGQLQQTLHGHTKPVKDVVFSPDGVTLASCSFGLGPPHSVKLWDIKSGTMKKALPGQFGFGVSSIAFNTDGNQLVCAVWRPVSFGVKKPAIDLWNVENGKLIRVFNAEASWAWSAVLSRGDKRLAAAAKPGIPTGFGLTKGGKLKEVNQDNRVRLWDVATGELHMLRGHTAPVNTVAFTPDGKRLASASEDKTVKFWDAENGHLILTLHSHLRGVTDMVFSRDGKRLVTASKDGTVKIWDAHKVMSGGEVNVPK